MTKLRKAKIVLRDHGKGEISLDGIPIPNVFAIKIEATAVDTPVLTISIHNVDVEFEADVDAKIERLPKKPAL
jgi:hypothetical protein